MGGKTQVPDREVIRSMSTIKTIIAIISVLVIASPFAVTAGAAEQGDLGTISPDNPTLEEEFPPIPGVYPREGAQFFVRYKPETCRKSSYCDAHHFTFELPSYPGTWGLVFTLTWSHPEETDLDMFVWADDDPALGPPISDPPCRNPTDEDCENLYPETFGLTEIEPSTYYMSVVNDSAKPGEKTGIHTSYTLKIEYFEGELELPPLPEFSPPSGRRFSPPPTVGGQDEGDGGFGLTDDSPEPSPTTIKVPGPDGELVEMELPVYVEGAAARQQDEGVSPIVPITAAIVMLAAAVGGFFFVRKRREGETGY